MSITDELREYANKAIHRKDYMLGLSHDLMRIADRIDAAHEALRDQLDTSERQKESYREDLLAANRRAHASYNDGFDDGFASADDWYADHADELREHGWVRLPVGADGVTWTGEERVFEEANGRRHAMYGLMHDGERWYVDCGLVGPDKHHHLIETTLVRHANPDTWERIIEDVRRRTSDYYCNNIPCNFDKMAAEMVARCRALAGETE